MKRFLYTLKKRDGARERERAMENGVRGREAFGKKKEKKFSKTILYLCRSKRRHTNVCLQKHDPTRSHLCIGTKTFDSLERKRNKSPVHS